VSWLDLGWLRRGDAWEFHAWGPFLRGYLLSESEAEWARPRVRLVRAAMVVAGLGALVPWVAYRLWWPAVVIAVFGGSLEAFLTWWVVRRYSRTESTLGWENGLVYLAKWACPKLLTLARIASVVLVGVSVWLVIQQPNRLGAYLLVGAFVAVQFLLNYLEQVSRS